MATVWYLVWGVGSTLAADFALGAFLTTQRPESRTTIIVVSIVFLLLTVMGVYMIFHGRKKMRSQETDQLGLLERKEGENEYST